MSGSKGPGYRPPGIRRYGLRPSLGPGGPGCYPFRPYGEWPGLFGRRCFRRVRQDPRLLSPIKEEIEKAIRNAKRSGLEDAVLGDR